MKGMTGRDLILYILSNGLEDEPVFKNGRLLGFATESEAAAAFGVGRATIRIWVERGDLEAVRIGDQFYIPKNATNPMERNKDEKVNSVTSNLSTRGGYVGELTPSS